MKRVLQRKVNSGCLQDLSCRLSYQSPDALLALSNAFEEDPRRFKIDVGVGIYRDRNRCTPVLTAVKKAEACLVNTQQSKKYLGVEGDRHFIRLIQHLVFGENELDGRITGLQTPGATGALRMAAELIRRARPRCRVLVGNPTWPNHLAILKEAGLDVVEYEYFDINKQSLDFEQMLRALSGARPGDVALLHACCHNPTGADLAEGQWQVVAELLHERMITPLVDTAYQGFGLGLEPDASGLRILVSRVREALVAYSCSKNFGLYRERTGVLFSVSGSAAAAALIQSNLLSLARTNWSMPPDHGAAVARVILEDEELSVEWRVELDEMRKRVSSVRSMLSVVDPLMSSLIKQQGIFCVLPISPCQVEELREVHAIYMTSSGRINISGLVPAVVPQFVAALAAVR